MKINWWVIADTHFGHEHMQKYCQRPVGFEDKIMSNLQNKVKENDVIIHLGDFCIGNDLQWHLDFRDSCLGKKWLVKGNHDRKTNSWYLDHGWDFVADEISIRMFGEIIVLSHMPSFILGDEINVHGHQHNTGHHPECNSSVNHKLVYIEHEYSPVLLRKVIGK